MLQELITRMKMAAALEAECVESGASTLTKELGVHVVKQLRRAFLAEPVELVSRTAILLVWTRQGDFTCLRRSFGTRFQLVRLGDWRVAFAVVQIHFDALGIEGNRGSTFFRIVILRV